MALKIKKQYKNPDGTTVEVEGTEAEIESFEKKQQKQKQQIENEQKKKTILYGKDLEAIRQIVREEIENAPRRITHEYRYIYQPQYTTPGYIWSSTPSITCDNGTIDASSIKLGDNNVNVYTAKTDAVSSVLNSGWMQSNTAGFLMSPKSEI